MALTKEFVEAVNQGSLLRVRIMLKDSLLVDTSFEQFNEMLKYAEPRLKGLLINDAEDTEEFSQSPDELNYILVGLVNNFSRRRIAHLKKLIQKVYPPKPKHVITDNGKARTIIPRTRAADVEFHSIFQEQKNMIEVWTKIRGKREKNNVYDIAGIATIRKAAMNIIEHCDKISGK